MRGWGLAIGGEDDGVWVVRRGEDVGVRARTPSSFLVVARGPFLSDAGGIVVLMVSGDLVRVERELTAGLLRCPGCRDRLARWAFARRRTVRLVDGDRRVRPRRVRCVGCKKTQVLLPDDLLVRRRDEAAVIGSALLAHAGGEGHRPIAERLGVPATTVRGWLRRFRARAVEIAGFFSRWALVLNPGSDPPGPSGTAVGDAVEAVGVATRSAVLRFGPRPVWSMASRLTGGGLLANTSSLWLAPS